MAGDDSEVTVNAFGKSVSIKGIGTLFIVVVLVFAAGLSWMLYDLSHSSAKAVKEALSVQAQTAVEHKAIMEAALSIKENQSVILEGVKRIEGTVKVQNWILLADPSEKAEIKQKMNMPRELRDMGVRER